MKAFKLVEKRENVVSPITYKVVPSKSNEMLNVYLVKDYGSREDQEVWLTTYIKETKRGWTITCWLLTVKPIEIFLPRENFEQVPIAGY